MEAIKAIAAGVREETMIPEISRESYLKEYNQLLNWKTASDIDVTDEDTMLAYFKHLSGTYAPST